MLKNICVKNFKAISDSGMLPLQPFTVLIGRNGSGKSSLIESLDWLSRAVDAGTWAATERFHRVRDIIHNWDSKQFPQFEIELEFNPKDASIDDYLQYRIRVGAMSEDGIQPRISYESLQAKIRNEMQYFIKTTDDTRVRRTNIIGSDKPATTQTQTRKDGSVKVRRAKSMKESYVSISDSDRFALQELDQTQSPAGFIFHTFLSQAVFLRLYPRSIANFAPQFENNYPRLIDDEGQALAALLTTYDKDRLQLLIEQLGAIIQRVTDIQGHIPQSPADRRFFNIIESRADDVQLQIPAWVLSEGLRRITVILAVVLHPDPPALLCIEEVENGLDPWTLRALLEELMGAVARENTQIILTTHSPHFLNLLPLESIILCHRDVDGVRFTPGSEFTGLETLMKRMGPGDLYLNRYLHRQVNESE